MLRKCLPLLTIGAVSLLMAGEAKAKDIYSDNGYTFRTDMEVEADLQYANKDAKSDNDASATSFIGTLDLNLFGSKQVTNDFKITGVVQLDLDPWSHDVFSYDDTYAMFEHNTYGTVYVGKIQGIYDKISDFADVEWVSNVGSSTDDNTFFGADLTSAILYQYKLGKFVLKVQGAPGDNKNTFDVDSSNTLLKKFGYGAGVDFLATDSITMAFGTSEVNYTDQQSDISDMGTSNIIGIKYKKDGLMVGTTATYEQYSWHDVSMGLERRKEYSFDFGLVYDQGADLTGWVPQIYYTYLKRNSFDSTSTTRQIEDNLLEPALLYYVSPNFHYQVIASLDLRDKAAVKEAESDNPNGNRNHKFVVGAVYDF